MNITKQFKLECLLGLPINPDVAYDILLFLYRCHRDLDVLILFEFKLYLLRQSFFFVSLKNYTAL